MIDEKLGVELWCGTRTQARLMRNTIGGLNRRRKLQVGELAVAVLTLRYGGCSTACGYATFPIWIVVNCLLAGGWTSLILRGAIPAEVRCL